MPDQNGKTAESNIGQRITACRDRMGISQGALAKAIGMTQSSVSMMEAGKVRFKSAQTLALIAKTLNVTVEYLMEGKSNDEDE